MPGKNVIPQLNQDRSGRLKSAFAPDCLAVVGASATRGKWSNEVFRLLKQSFRGTLLPINPARESVEGVRTFPSIAAVRRKIDYVQVVVERETVLEVVRECVDAKIPVVHVLSAGFAEVPGSGEDLQRRLLKIVEGSETVLIGPNSMGLYSARAGITFARGCHFEPGSTAFVSQSGGLCYDMLSRGQARGLGFSKILSVGNCTDLDWPDYVRHFASDRETDVLALYVESVADGGRLFQELQAAARHKPVIVLKGGRTQRGSLSVVSHTGRMAGEYEIWRAMLRQAGVIEAGSFDELLTIVQASNPTKRSSGAKGAGPCDAMVIGTGGGATVLIADACETASINLASICTETIHAFENEVPNATSLGGIGNPLDIGADRLLSDPALLGKLIEAAGRDTNVGAVLVHLNLIAVANNLAGGLETWIETCRQVGIAASADKPVCLLLRNGDGGPELEKLHRAAQTALRGTKVSVLTNIGDALCFVRHVLSPGNRPAVQSHQPNARLEGEAGTAETGRMLASHEARALAEDYGIALSPWAAANDAEAALAAAEHLRYPVALKTAAADITHKSDVGCVRLNLTTPEAVRDAYSEIARKAKGTGSATPHAMIVERMAKGVAEVAIGFKRSSTFGPMLMVGAGGIWVEVIRDFALRLCPLDHVDALEMIGELRALPTLTGGRGRPQGDIDALAQMMIAVSRLAASRPDVAELDLNPVMLLERGLGAVAVDVRASLRFQGPV